MTGLSPVAQAVLDAALPVYDDEYLYVAPMEKHAGMIAAAALRAAADQVVPESIVYIPTSDGTMRRVDELWIVRRGVYAIAAELEGQ